MNVKKILLLLIVLIIAAGGYLMLRNEEGDSNHNNQGIAQEDRLDIRGGASIPDDQYITKVLSPQEGEVLIHAVHVALDAVSVAPGVGAQPQVLLHREFREQLAAFGYVGDAHGDDGLRGAAVDGLAKPLWHVSRQMDTGSSMGNSVPQRILPTKETETVSFTPCRLA